MKICKVKGCDRRYEARGYCDAHYNRLRRGLQVEAPLRVRRSTKQSYLEIFFSRLNKQSGPNGDGWEYVGHRDNFGYGKMNDSDGRNVRSHRFSWEYHNKKKIPEGMLVLHSCDNPPCCNPDHLRTGNYQENMNDMKHRGRAADNKGELNPNSKLTKKDVIEIYDAVHNGESQKSIAARYRINRGTVSKIKLSKQWKHLLEAHRKFKENER